MKYTAHRDDLVVSIDNAPAQLAPTMSETKNMKTRQIYQKGTLSYNFIILETAIVVERDIVFLDIFSTEMILSRRKGINVDDELSLLSQFPTWALSDMHHC